MPGARTEPLAGGFPQDAAAAGALGICAALRSAGHVAWLAGGCVRDLVLGVPIADFDIATDATTEVIQRLFPRVILVGEAFGVCRVADGELGWEVASFRTEAGYSDGRHPDSVRAGTPEEDARRRDFTINGLFLDPERMAIVDFVDGLEDLRVRRVLRAIGDPRERFAEDYLRMMRAVRFVARTGFALESATAAAIRELAGQLRRVSSERVTDELRKTFALPAAAAGLVSFIELGLALVLLPEVVPAPASRERAGWLARVRAQAEAVTGVMELPDRSRDFVGSRWLLCLAVLLDSSAAGTGSLTPRELGELVAERLRLSRQEARLLLELIECRRALVAEASASLAARVRLCRRPGFAPALALLAAQAHEEAGALVASWQQLLATRSDIAAWPAPFLAAADFIAAGLAPSPELGSMIARLEDEQIEGRITSRDEAIAWMHEQLRRE